MGIADNCKSTLICYALAVLGTVLILCVLSNPAAARSSSLEPDNIINGTPVGDNEKWPWMVALVRNDRNDTVPRCSGTLVAPNRVLTAAHCVLGTVGPTDIDAIVGRNDISQTDIGQRVHVASISVYQTPAGGEKDIALLKLAESVNNIPPVRLAIPSDALQWVPGSQATALGYGLTTPPSNEGPDGQGPTPSKILHETELTVVAHDECERSAAPMLVDPQTTVCAQDKTDPIDSTTCGGDSGGPLLVGNENSGYIQVGITSEGTSWECSPRENTTIYTLVSAFHSFIVQADQSLVSKPYILSDPEITGDSSVGSTLTCSPGTWGGDSAQFTFEWSKDDPNTGFPNVLPDRSNTHQIVLEDIGQTLSCFIRVKNNGGTSFITVRREL